MKQYVEETSTNVLSSKNWQIYIQTVSPDMMSNYYYLVIEGYGIFKEMHSKNNKYFQAPFWCLS